MLRHKVKAGMMGWDQINRWCGNTSLKKRIECDLEYAETEVNWFNIKILPITHLKSLIHQDAY